jgi:hypothetical protein
MMPRESSVEAPADARWRRIALRVAEPLSVAVLFICLLEKTWLRWSDPLIDFPRSLYAAWRLNEGDLLYVNVVSWYGPLPHLVEAAAFRVFGVGLDTMVWLNIAVTVVAVLLLRAIFGTLGNRLMRWLSAVVFLPVFAFGHYNVVANYNFITPYASQATYGFAGLLLMLWALLRHLKSERPGWLGVAGLGLAVTYLDKPEPLLAALGALGIYLLARTIQFAKKNAPLADWAGAGGWLGRGVGWLAGGFFCAWLPVFVFFLCRGGLAYAFYAADYVPYTMFGGLFRQTVESSVLMQDMIGFNQPGKNFLFELWQGGWFALLCGLMIVVSRDWARQKRFGEAWWALLALVVVLAVVCAALARLGYDLGPEFVFPVCVAAAVYGWRSLRAAWRGGADFSRVLGLAVVGAAAALMLGRMILNAHILHFGFFLMPLAVMFWIHLMVVEAARAAAAEARRNCLLPAVFSALVLVGTATLWHTSWDCYVLKNFAVGAGRDRFYTFQPKDYTGGEFLRAMIEAVQQKAPNAQTLAAFPEGIAVNYHLRIRCPLAELEFQPLALGYAGPAHVLNELKAHPPDVVLFYYRDLLEYGFPYFGADEASGRDIMLWANEHYTPVFTIGPTQKSVTGNDIDMLVPKSATAP